MGKGALLNLVRLNTADVTAPEHDYTAGEVFERHEEIKLEDPNGEPCAIPLPAQFQNLDHKFNYVGGDKGEQLRRLARNLLINVDYISNAVATRLERWMHQRAHVLVCPNFGRHTDFSWRPVRVNGTSYPEGGTFTDLTGNHPLESDANTNASLLWDYEHGRFIAAPTVEDVSIISTPGGGAWGSPALAVNRVERASPGGANVGVGASQSGWYTAGVDSADHSFGYNATGFGHPDCPGSLIVTMAASTSTDRYMYIQNIWNSGHGNYLGRTWTGASQAVACVWLRGQMPDGAQLDFGLSTNYKTVDLSGANFPGWTPVLIAQTEADWSTSVPALIIRTHSAEAFACTFEVGPVMVQHVVDRSINPSACWTDYVLLGLQHTIETVSAYTFPGVGTMIASFWLPEDINAAGVGNLVMSMISSGDFNLSARILTGVIEYATAALIGVGSNGISATPYKRAGINTMAFSWGNTNQKLYINGVLVATIATRVPFDTASVLRLGDDGQNGGLYPACLLSVRIDEGVKTDDEVTNIHLALTDPIALQFAMQARGRIFRITQVPQMLRSSAGGSQVLGTIGLEQVGLQNQIADPLNVEEILR